jgi:diazepam-binding inhibitor (GABA receptor modulating acyl-CoA-binding protein)
LGRTKDNTKNKDVKHLSTSTNNKTQTMADNNIEERFQLAIKYVQQGLAKEQYGESGKELTTQDQLEFYGLYKIATVGDNNEPAPWSINVVARQKWEAWHKLNGMDPLEAKRRYIAKLTELAPEWESYIRSKQQ